MDELYRRYRIALTQTDRWVARITHVRGNLVPSKVQATLEEGESVCLARAKAIIDRYLAFLELPG